RRRRGAQERRGHRTAAPRATRAGGTRTASERRVNTLAPLTAAQAALNPLKPTYYGDELVVDSDGFVTLPTDAAFYVLRLITGNPTWQWGAGPYGVATIQVAAWSVVEG